MFRYLNDVRRRILRKSALMVALASVMSASAAQAQLLDVRQTVYGMD